MSAPAHSMLQRPMEALWLSLTVLCSLLLAGGLLVACALAAIKPMEYFLK